jgi:orotate phosphoribosyltransferase
MEVINQLGNIDVFSILKETNSIMEGHFKLSSGYHSNFYLQCAKLLQYPDKTAVIIEKGLEIFRKDLNKKNIQTVISPAIGGILFGYMLAYKMGVKMIFTERKDKEMELRRNFEIKQGEKVIIAEDVITTGGSVFEVIEICKKNNAEIKGIISIVDRSENIIFDYPYFYFIKLKIDKYSPEICPLCSQNKEIYYPGSKK